MRLSKRAKSLIDFTIFRALQTPCEIVAPVASWGRARRIFDAVDVYVAERGGKADRAKLQWNFANGSTIRISVNGTHTKI